MGGRPPWLPHPTKIANGVRPLASHVSTLAAAMSSLPSTDFKSYRLERAKIWDGELLHGWWGWHRMLIRCVAC